MTPNKRKSAFALPLAEVISFLLIAASTLLSGCAIPLPSVTESITDVKNLSVTLGQTSRAEVLAVLGEPNLIWETERVLVYKQGPAVRVLWIVPGYYAGGGIVITDIGEDVVIMQVDKSDRIERLERRTGIVDGKFLQNWIAEKE